MQRTPAKRYGSGRKTSKKLPLPLILIAVVLVGGFLFFAMQDIAPQQQLIEKTVDHPKL